MMRTVFLTVAIVGIALFVTMQSILACEDPVVPEDQNSPTYSCKCPDGSGVVPPYATGCPVYLKTGSVIEQATDLTVECSGVTWTQSRTYNSSATSGYSVLGGSWLCDNAEHKVTDEGGKNGKYYISLLVNASSKRTFWIPGDAYSSAMSSNSKVRFISPKDSTYYSLTKYYSETDSCYYYELVDAKTHRLEIFNASGNIIKATNSAWAFSLGSSSGPEITYTYNNSNELISICTANGQDYYIGFTYTGSGSSLKLTKIEVKTSATGTLLKDVTYTYFDSSTHSSSIGSSGDLVQVKTRELNSAGTGWIVHYTQYRYYTSSDTNGQAHCLKSVFEPDAVQRILDDRTDITDADTVLTKTDTDGSTGHQIQDFANRRFTYYISNFDTGVSITTAFGSENLQTKYGGIECTDVGTSTDGTTYYRVKSETVGGCSGCGSTGGISRYYYYMCLNHSSTLGVNDVVTLVVEDTVDANSAGAFRKIHGLSDGGQRLREALITDPCGTPKFWCQSWVLYDEDTDTTIGDYWLNRLYQHRTRAAQNVTSSNIAAFLDPTTGTNDADTLNTSSGLIKIYDYSAAGYQMGERVKEGSGGTAYFVWEKYFYDSSNPNTEQAPVSEYTYTEQSTGLSNYSRITTDYELWSTYGAISKRTITQPVVTTSQNGSGVSSTQTQYYDETGLLRWEKDAEGYWTYYAYSPKFGKLAYIVRDAMPGGLPSSRTETTKWTGGVINFSISRDTSLPTAVQQVTKFEFDDVGREVSWTIEDGQTGTDLAKRYTVYESNRTLRFPYWDSTNSRSLVPIEVTVTDNGGRTTETYTVDPSCVAVTSGVPTGLSSSTSQSNYQSWIRYNYKAVTGELLSVDTYHTIPTSGTGSLSTNFYREAYLYDAQGRRGATIQVVSSTVDQVNVSIFDALGQVVAVKQGVYSSVPTDYTTLASTSSPPSWLKTVSQSEYDSGNAGGNSLVTREIKYHGTGTTDNTGIQYYYTFRGHQRAIRPFKNYDGSTDTSVGPYTIYDIDWLGRTTAQGTYTSAPTTWPTDYTAYADTTAANRVALSESSYDVFDRVYCSKSYTISSSDGSKGSKSQTNSYYDRRGNRVATAPKHAAATETAYDGLGRKYETRTVLLLKGDDGGSFYSSGAFQYRSPTPVATFSSSATTAMSGGDDKVMAMSHTVFDAAGNAIESHSFSTIDTDTNGINLTSGDYVRSSVYTWYDAANRMTASANYGCGNTSTDTWKYAAMPTRASTAPTASSTTALVSLATYDSASGLLQQSTNPMGQKTRMFYDALGRTTYVVNNYDNFSTPASNTGDSSDPSKDRVTKTEYNGLGKVTKLIALDQSGTGSTNNEVTTYLYEDAYNASLVTSTIYPDSSDTDSSGSDQVKVTYNLDGSVATKTDQRGTVMQYTYNDRRQLALEAVTTLGGDTDGYVRSIARAYDSLGRLTTLTSYSAADGTGTVRNQVAQTYADYGPVTTEWQSHSGEAVTSGTSQSPNVQYGFDTTASSSIYQNGLRLQQVTYPNGRVLYYQYGATTGGADDLMSRVSHIYQTSTSGTLLAQYGRMGSGQITVTSYPEPQLRNTLLVGGTAGEYDGLDRFGRIKDHLWANYGTSTNVVRIQHGYDYASNRIYRADPIAAANSVNLDEYYSYDGLNQLKDLQRGQLTTAKDGISGTADKEETWTLDGLGNWSNYLTKTSGTTDLDQTRTHDLANELTQIDSSTTHVAEDAAGNMTRIPKPSSWSSHYDLTYDAWNRLVKIADSDVTVAEYQYDGRNYRTVKKTYSSGSLAETCHFYYNGDWQCLEERLESDSVISSYANCQNVWGERYVDGLILRDRDTDADGTLDERLYAMQDPNWNTVAIASTSCAVAERYSYTAYGKTSFLTSTFASQNTNTSNFAWDTLYTSRQYDYESGICQYRNRFYEAEMGKFLSRDPIGYDDGTNLYEYVDDDPIERTDPMGTCGLDPNPPPSNPPPSNPYPPVSPVIPNPPGGCDTVSAAPQPDGTCPMNVNITPAKRMELKTIELINWVVPNKGKPTPQSRFEKKCYSCVDRGCYPNSKGKKQCKLQPHEQKDKKGRVIMKDFEAVCS